MSMDLDNYKNTGIHRMIYLSIAKYLTNKAYQAKSKSR